jgi:hypothetical protein
MIAGAESTLANGTPTNEIDREIQDLVTRVKALSFEHKKQFGTWPSSLFDGAGVVPRPELLAHSTVVSDRLEILRRIPKEGVFAEVGTLRGEFALKILEIYKPEELHLFDLSFHHISDETKAILDKNVTGWHKGYSWETLDKMPNHYFDVIYIDADHSFEAVKKDIASAHRKTKPGGWIIFNDYTSWAQPNCTPFGVFAAANRFANEHNVSLHYLALHPNGFYDAAFRLPE